MHIFHKIRVGLIIKIIFIFQIVLVEFDLYERTKYVFNARKIKRTTGKNERREKTIVTLQNSDKIQCS